MSYKQWAKDHPEKAREHSRKADSRRDPVKRVAWAKKNYAENKHQWRDAQLRAKYGITLVEYNEMLARQQGVCAVCATTPGKRALSVDHCHETGLVRGLLCAPCNTALGALREDPLRMRALEAYIRQFNWMN